MRQAAMGDTVRVHYRGTLEDGSEFDSSAGRDPLEFTLGGGQIIPGFEQAVIGMSEGERKSVTLQPDEAYGQPRPELIHAVERSQIPAEVELSVGAELSATDPQGNQTRLIVIEVSDTHATLDANHPLAGAALTFELHLESFAG